MYKQYRDMLTNLILSDGDLVILGVFAFLGGLAGMTIYTKVRGLLEVRLYKTNEAVVEAIVLEYTRRLCGYDKVISDFQVKLNILEDSLQSHSEPSQHTSQVQPHVAQVAEPVTITQHSTIEDEVNSTTDYILKLLTEKSRSSREVQLAIGRTREHTSRLMKKLHDSGLVRRDVNATPFRYSITDAGQEMLAKRVGAASVVV